MQSNYFADLIEKTHADWQGILLQALNYMAPDYLQALSANQAWLPGPARIFAAFSQPMRELDYILVGESPYPRAVPANGYAFWDAAVGSLWSSKGLSKEVNRATSLRNFIKMLLVARGELDADTSQEAIADLDKSIYVQTGKELFEALIKKGFLLLNACLVYVDEDLKQHCRAWQPFTASIFQSLAAKKDLPRVLLFGEIAKKVPNAELFSCLRAEHPYNLSFIRNSAILDFFRPLNLLEASCKN